jgi:hypothetical protein
VTQNRIIEHLDGMNNFRRGLKFIFVQCTPRARTGECPSEQKKDRINGGLSRACAWIYFALTKPNMASDIASMSGAAISTLKSITEALEKTVKNKVSKTPVPMM